MKKIIILLVTLICAAGLFAQETEKRTLERNGDVIEATLFHENGIVSQEGQYTLDGKLQGKWISYDVNGNKTAVAQYNNGQKTGTWYFYEGEVLKEVKYSQNRVAQVTTWKDAETKIVSN